jgi:hypothetical protein
LSSVLNTLYNPTLNSISFVKEGSKTNNEKKKSEYKGVLAQAKDWEITIDLNNNYEFPFHVAETSLRPDIVIWSDLIKSIIFIELTVSMEERTAEAQKLKLSKYQDLASACSNQGYTAKSLTIEVGSRGWVAPSVYSCLKYLGINSELIKQCVRNCSHTALRMSYLIYVNRKNKKWIPWEWLPLMVPSFEGPSKK